VPLDRRLAPHLPGSATTPLPAELMRSWQLLFGPAALRIGSVITRALGLREELTTRLARVHASESATAFRLRQIGWSAAGFGVAAAVATVLAPPPLLVALFLLGAPERALLEASRRWQRRVFLELPVLCEQLAMLLSAGYSVGAAINRLSTRGSSCGARDLARVARRIQHGVSEQAALSEWAEVSGVPAVARLVGVLCLDRDLGDLSSLVGQEARSIRQDVHRELIETIERRAQQVWIPVTVATLVPGVLFLVAPFVAAMQLFAGS
jgi:Flp pilus assembly protein TadB